MFKIVIVLLISTVVVCGQGQTSRDYRNGYSPPVKEQTFPAEPGLWEELHPKIPRTDYLGLAFSDEQTGWATGAGGAIIKTTNAGVTWVKKQSNTTATLTTIATHNGVDLIAAGFEGTFLYSSDGGESWVQKTLPTTSNFWNLRFVTERIVWLCGEGGNLFRSEDGGVNWNVVTTPLGNTAYWDVFFVDSLYGFVGSNGGKLLKTIDGGQSWSIKQAGWAQHIYTVAAPDRNNITVAGAFQKLSYSSDGGETWIDHPAGSPPHYNKAIFVNDTLGYLVGTGTGMMRTTDKGASWTFKSAEFNEWNICFPGGVIGYIAGEDMTLKKTTNRGDEWDYMVIKESLQFIQQVTESEIWMLGGNLYKSANKGLTWHEVYTGHRVNSFYMVDTLVGFSGSNRNKIFKTTNGGVSWSEKTIIGLTDTGNVSFINVIRFTEPCNGWALSWNRGTYKTLDCGETWTVQSAEFGGAAIQIFDSLALFSISGYLNKTFDGGFTWERLLLPGINSSDLFFIDSMRGFVLSLNKLHKTTDGGNTWYQIPEVTDFGFAKFGWLDKGHGIIVGTQTFETRDGGMSWENITNQINEALNGVSSFLPNTAYAVGNMGLIMNYSDTAYVPVELHSFTFLLSDNNVTLQWQTSSEINNSGFEIERSNDGVLFQKVGFVKGNGTTTEPQHFTFTDTYTTNCFYRLRQIDYNGTSNYSDLIEVKENLEINGINLNQNFPNPFNSESLIIFTVDMRAFATLELFSITGEKITTLFQDIAEQGKKYEIRLSSSELASGIYYCILRQGVKYKTIKVVFLK